MSNILLLIFLFISEVDSRFDKGSKSLARNWEHVKSGLPHERIPNDAEKIQDVGDWGMDYGIVCKKNHKKITKIKKIKK